MSACRPVHVLCSMSKKAVRLSKLDQCGPRREDCGARREEMQRRRALNASKRPSRVNPSTAWNGGASDKGRADASAFILEAGGAHERQGPDREEVSQKGGPNRRTLKWPSC